jgi:hypothetical protein
MRSLSDRWFESELIFESGISRYDIETQIYLLIFKHKYHVLHGAGIFTYKTG